MDDKNNRRLRRLTLSILLGILASCTVKENRWICPCHLIFQAERQEDLERDGSIVLTVFEGEEKELSQAYSWRSIRDEDYTATVSKGEKNMSIVMNKERSFITGTKLMIKEGEDADSLWASSVRASCVEDVFVVPVEPRKEHACVHLALTGYRESNYPFRLQVVGNVCGMELISLRPIEGAFRYEAPLCRINSEEFKPEIRSQMQKLGFDKVWDTAEVKHSFILPRQIADDDYGLYLNLYNKSNSTNNYKPVIIPLGNIISHSGYDWTGADLKDIFITLDFVDSEGLVMVQDWESGWQDSITI